MIVAEDIYKKFNDTVALNRVNITISTGSIFGLLGPNGAGKTTFIRILTRIYLPDGGTVLINDNPLNELNARKIGYLPEERGLYKKMKVGELILYMARLRGLKTVEAKEQMNYWFGRFDIRDWSDKRIDSLSKGMQQKVQFIIAVLHRPEFLILDEPFSGLDPLNTEAIENEILELHKSGTTIVFSTHNMDSVERFCERVVLIDKGQVVLSGTVDEVKQAHKQSLYEFKCREHVDFLNERIAKSGTVVSSELKSGVYTVLAKLNTESEADGVLIDIAGKVKLTSFCELLPSMNDIFIESVKNKNEEL